MQRAEDFVQGRTQVQIVLDLIDRIANCTPINKSNYGSDIAAVFGLTDTGRGLARLLWLTELLDQAKQVIVTNVPNELARTKYCDAIRDLSTHVVGFANIQNKPTPVGRALLAEVAMCEQELSHYSVPLELGRSHLDQLSEYLYELKAMPSFVGDPDDLDKWTEIALIGLQDAIRDYPLFGISAFEKHLSDLVFRLIRAVRCSDSSKPRSEKTKKAEELVLMALELTDDLHGYQHQVRQFEKAQIPPAALSGESYLPSAIGQSGI
jgi:hypothetical protein